MPSAADDLGRQRAAAEVTPLDVVNHVSKFYQRGKRGAADKARSYIASAFAWAITITLLSTIARIASWAISEGGRLALYADPSKEQMKQLVRELIAESRRS